MTDETIPDLPAAATLTGSEPVETVQGGNSVRTTTQAIADLAPGGGAPSFLVESGPSKEVSAMTAAAGLDGTELVPLVQAGGNVRTTTQAIADLGAGGSPAILVESGPAEMISAMPAVSPLTGAEVVAVLQGGANKRTTAQAVANLAPPTTVPAAILVESGIAKKISALSAASALTGTEEVAILQAGATVAATAQNIANLASTGLTVNTTAATSYAYAIGDAGTWRQFTAGSAITATIPSNASVPFPIGATILNEQVGAGVIAFTPAGGVTLNSNGGKVHSNGLSAVASLVKTGTNTWNLSGNLV